MRRMPEWNFGQKKPMESQKQKCALPAIPVTDEPVSAEVDMAQFAAIAGMSSNEFYGKLLQHLENGDVFKLLKEASRREVMVWALNTIAEGADKLMIAFRLSINTEKDTGLFCTFRVDEGMLDTLAEALLFPELNSVPKMAIQHAIPSYMTSPPKEADMDGFEINFCDMETAI